jgi:hypothetical protein
MSDTVPCMAASSAGLAAWPRHFDSHVRQLQVDDHSGTDVAAALTSCPA